MASDLHGEDNECLLLKAPGDVWTAFYILKQAIFIPIGPSSRSHCWLFAQCRTQRHQETFTLLHGFPLIAAQRCLQSQQEMVPALKPSDWKRTYNIIFSHNIWALEPREMKSNEDILVGLSGTKIPIGPVSTLPSQDWKWRWCKSEHVFWSRGQSGRVVVTQVKVSLRVSVRVAQAFLNWPVGLCGSCFSH